MPSCGNGSSTGPDPRALSLIARPVNEYPGAGTRHGKRDRVIPAPALLGSQQHQPCQREDWGGHDLPNSSQYNGSSRPPRRVGAVQRASDLALQVIPVEPRYGIEP